ncbi:hypothetical protein T05_224 [Trichinella murrelli]|uniref:Uncharacterized protein n=1 Tax=Trichinella murrelli TaxID=144512 RepID=A0A0V0SWQ8_9BILA|nr:hypothetical protein T05_224 [Trichinella murrelli]
MFRSFRSKCGILLIYFIHDSITLMSSEYDISSDGPVS